MSIWEILYGLVFFMFDDIIIFLLDIIYVGCLRECEKYFFIVNIEVDECLVKSVKIFEGCRFRFCWLEGFLRFFWFFLVDC